MKELLKSLSLREKIGQTAMPSPPVVRKGVVEEGGYANYLKKYPFNGIYFQGGGMVRADGSKITKSHEFAQVVKETNAQLKIPMFVSVDAEFGAGMLFDDMTKIATNMAVGAANSSELAYKRTYYWAKELKSAGINWAFGPVCDRLPHFMAPTGIRCISDKKEMIMDLIPHAIKGIQDAGVIATAKHYPGGGGDYRDSHFSMVSKTINREQWDEEVAPVWKAATKADVASFMVGHVAYPNIDPSCAKSTIPRPATASSKMVGILRDDIGFDGLIVTDAVSMKSLAAAFDHDDIYIECLNAGNDVILFTGNDYIDVIEKAVNDGRVSIERVEEAALRVLEYKKKFGLFDGEFVGEAMTEEDKKDFNETNYNIFKKGATLIGNDGRIPFDPTKVKKVTIVPLAPSEKFHEESIKFMQDAFSGYGIESKVVSDGVTKTIFKEISEDSDLIIYACYLAIWAPTGLPAYSQPREMDILYNALSYGSEKSIVASFGHPSVYFNYFEGMPGYINMYAATKESMQAFVDGIFGKFEFTGKSPVALRP